MCPHPSSHVREIVSETSEDEEIQHNIWNKMLKVFTLQEAVLCYNMIWKIGSYAGWLYLVTSHWTSFTPFLYIDYDDNKAMHQRKLEGCFVYVDNEGMYRGKVEDCTHMKYAMLLNSTKHIREIPRRWHVHEVMSCFGKYSGAQQEIPHLVLR